MRWLSRGLTVLSAMLLLGLPADGTSIAGKPPAGSGGERPRADQPPDDLALALRYAPIVHLDRLDPFLPTFAGYTIFRRDGESPSFPRRVTLRPGPLEIDANDARDIAALFPDGRLPEVPEIEAALVIEYAIWWDWDIQHLYELEHAWSYVGADGRLLYAEGSWHGSYFPMVWQGATPHQDDHPLLYSQPGKHAFVPDPSVFTASVAEREYTRRACYLQAGRGGLLLKQDLFEGKIAKTTARDRLATAYLQARKFDPSFDFTQTGRFDEWMLVPWPALYDWIPGRIDRILTDLGAGRAPDQ